MGHQSYVSYVVKWPVFRLQRGSAKSPIAPSDFSPLWISGPNHLSNLRTKVFPALTLHPKTLGSEGYWSHIWKFLHFHRIFPISKSCQIIPETWGSKFMISISNKIKPNYFKKQRFSSWILLTRSKYTGSKWPWSTLHASFMHLRNETSLLSIPG